MIRFLDVFFSGILILLLTPFLLPIMLLLKFTGEHHVFYRQIRIGKHGKEFGLFKFATMLKNSPNLPGGLYTEKNDPRLLPLGSFLRKSKINELPQLLNIFIGQMSFVGYRPTVPSHFGSYPEEARKALYESRPGLTGIGSVVFRDEEAILHSVEDKAFFHSKIISPYKAELESWYVQHRSLGLYFGLIFTTAMVVAMPMNARWRSWFKDLPAVPEALVPYLTAKKDKME